MAKKKKETIGLSVVPNITEARTLAQRDAKQLTPLVKELSELVPTEPEHYEMLGDYGRKVKSAKDSITAREKTPLMLVAALRKEIKGWFEPFHQKCDEARTLVEEKLDQYEEHQEEVAEKARLAAEKKAEAKRQRLLKKAKTAPTMTARKALQEKARDVEVEETEEADIFQLEGAAVAYTWDVEVVDIDKVPSNFLIIELDKVKALEFIREHATDEMAKVAESNSIAHVDVPGVKFFKHKGRRFKSL